MGTRKQNVGFARTRAGLLAIVAFAGCLGAALRPAVAAEPGSRARVSRFALVDRAVVRFAAAEAGGKARPHFIYERELAFEARLTALSDPAFRPGREPYRRHHLQAALERHIAEVLLSALRLEEQPSAAAMAHQVQAARSVLEQQVGGPEALAHAAESEGIGLVELEHLFHRQARASFYLDTMVTPMLEPGEFELRRAHRSGKTPFSSLPFDEARPLVERWYIGQALRTAAANFYQSARSRLKVEFM
jgi:hypothetical protein